MEEVRQEKLVKKMEREQQQAQQKNQNTPNREVNADENPITITPCKLQPPFWWKHDAVEAGQRFKIDEARVIPQPDKSEYKTAFPRWQEEPDIFDQNLTDPCKRRAEMSLYVKTCFGGYSSKRIKSQLNRKTRMQLNKII